VSGGSTAVSPDVAKQLEGSSAPDRSDSAERKPAADDPEPSSFAVVMMRPSASQVFVGDTLSLAITIDGASDVSHAPFHVRFDPTVLRFVSGEEGSFLAGDGGPTAFFASETSAGGSVVVGLSRLGHVPGISGSGDLCILHFEVVGQGPSQLGFARAKIRDASNAIVPSEFIAAIVNAS
jgi:hypothetical protein